MSNNGTLGVTNATTEVAANVKAITLGAVATDTLNLNLNAGGNLLTTTPLINVNTTTMNGIGVTKVNVSAADALYANGTYPLVTTTTPIVGTVGTNYTLGNVPARLSGATLQINGNSLVLSAVGTFPLTNPTWTGAINSTWDVAGTSNWKIGAQIAPFNATKFYTADAITFDDTATSFAPVLNATALPSSVTFSNATNTYNLTGTGKISGTTSVVLTGAGTVINSLANDYSGGTAINAGTLVVTTDNNLGTAGTGVAIGNGTLMINANNYVGSGRTYTLADPNSTIAVTGANTATLGGTFAGTGALTVSNPTSTTVATQLATGTVNLTNPAALSPAALTVNGGTLNVGPATVFDTTNPNLPVLSGGVANASHIAGALTVNNGAALNFNPSRAGTGVTHTVGSLAIGPNGSVDIGNHTLLIQNAPDETVVQRYLANGYAAAFWNGTSPTGGSIRSVTAYNDQSGATSVGFGNAADFTFPGSNSPYAAGGPKALSGNQVVVQPALAGDVLLSGAVGPNELALLLASYGTSTYDGTHANSWAYGNVDYSPDGLVGPNDLALLLANYGKSLPGGPTASGGAAAKPSATSAKSAAARGRQDPDAHRRPVAAAAAAAVTSAASAALSPAVASNAIELDVDPATGHLFLNGNNALQVSSVVFNSASGALVGNDSSRFTGAFTALFPNNASDSATLINQFNSATAGATVNGSLDAGALFALGAAHDLTFQYSQKNVNRGGLQSGAVVFLSVPEPTSLSLLALGALGLLARRRKGKAQAD